MDPTRVAPRAPLQDSYRAPLDELIDLLRGRPLVALTGAGCSTESGIPDYRGTEASERSPAPILFQRFVRDPEVRARYWARSTLGWPRFARARPNPCHRALARMERAGALLGVLTQNVDGLHTGAGSRRVVELHGNLAGVRCMACGATEHRDRVQDRLLRLNPAWADRLAGFDARGEALAPDGDAAIPEGAARAFRVPACRACGGVLKPDVVFFGENVPPRRKEVAWDLYREAGPEGVLLVLGSSLAVASAFGFVRQAARDGRSLALVNLGPTRGDELARVRLEGRVGELMPRVAEALVAA